MEETATSGGGGGIPWLWGVASAAQMGLGVRSYIKGHAGDSCLMPLKAFSVASLFIGSAASASIFILQTNGIYGVDDLIEAGANLRAKLGLHPRTSNKNMDES
ncbi:StAR lipid transfer protein [Trifolium repens]|nr:StAR lipid transfer protein [Trifolium repens]